MPRFAARGLSGTAKCSPLRPVAPLFNYWWSCNVPVTMKILIAIVDKYNLKQSLLFTDRKASKTVIRPSLSVIYCHFRFCCVWARALPQPPGKPQHSTAALKETRRCCHHGRVGSKVLTYGQSYLERLVRRTEAGRWPRWFPGSLRHCQREERPVPLWQSGSSCWAGQKHFLSHKTQLFSIQLERRSSAQVADTRC